MFEKLNIFKSEWLDVVFEGRNKAYGAYELRKLGPKATNIALAIVAGVVAVFSATQVFDIKLFPKSEAPQEEIAFTEEVTLEDLVEELPPEEEPPVEEEAPKIAESKPALDVVALPEIKPVPKEKAVETEVATVEEATDKKKLIGPTAMKGMKGGAVTTEGKWGTKDVAGAATGSTKGVEGGTGTGDEIFTAVEVQPEPPGGLAAFRKWIGDNYAYPSGAIDAGVKGTIQVSFVVEKTGELTDIKVVRDLSYGTGQAAINLLKKAKKWSPGIQNGRPVRVAYTLPIRLDLTNM
ncbi:TonB family protein [Sphingobacterium alkalisoli]|uniref:TonB family protein n=1 Tax=Sphingobacterium alkalisoli TaxID=1874115 RepID=A0A4U0GQT9_9SPHI|nr:energy transducer TonB [Sphingobacterium alkalisoli]TJY61311.1 TonB family protein [Sphingobacterium alkalisoli]GGH31038.1 biopolymer transporter TonB [Sphingobacterium alkalisoli]